MPVRRDKRTGRWFFRAVVKLPDGRRQRIYGTPGVPGPYQDLAASKVGAQEAERRAIAEAMTGKPARGATPERKEVPAETVASYAEKWVAGRKGRVHSFRNDGTRFRLHINPVIGAMPLAEVRPRHVRDLVLGLRDKLAPRTLRNVYGTLHTMFRDAEIEELVVSNPVKVPVGTLPKKADKDPSWRATAVFTRQEVEALISDERIPLERRVLYSLLGLTGCRFGEVAALRWSAYDRTQEPLGMLSVHVSYDVQSRTERQVKTGVARRVPVHPVLRAILAEWRLVRPAGDDALIIPGPGGSHRNVHRALRCFRDDLDRLGLRARRQHDLRRSFITLAQVDGARRDLLEVVTHGPRGDIMTAYTSFPWSALCAEVAKLSIDRRGSHVAADAVVV